MSKLKHFANHGRCNDCKSKCQNMLSLDEHRAEFFCEETGLVIESTGLEYLDFNPGLDSNILRNACFSEEYDYLKHQKEYERHYRELGRPDYSVLGDY